MSYKALYREWRPKNFEEVVGQQHITITLKNQIKNESMAHAYLFSGTRGTGKTSTAKVLAKAVNCLDPKDGEPCNECEICKKINTGSCMDVVELDAASNNSVENIREIIDEVQYSPQEGKFKVYIIDEVHMLSMSAVNAFLKTLEEPPQNVIFILATTDPQRLPITILSRCQRFDFKRINNKDVFERLRKIVDEKGIFADDKSLSLISRMSDGAMRDALSLLDQAIAMGNGKVDYNQVIDILGIVGNENIIKLVDNIIEENVEEAIKILDLIIFNGNDIYQFTKDLIKHMRNLIMVKVTHNPEEVLDMSKENIDIIKNQASKIRVEDIMRYIRILQEAEENAKWSRQSRIYLELAIIKMCKKKYDDSKETLLARINKLENIIKQGKFISANENETLNNQSNNNLKYNINKYKVQDEHNNIYNDKLKTQKQEELRDKEDNIEKNIQSTITLQKLKKSWKDILEIFKSRRKMVVYASLMTGKIKSCKEGVIQIEYPKEYAFNKSRLQKEENRKTVNTIFSEALQEKVNVVYSVEDEKQEKTPEEVLMESFPKEMIEIIDK